MGDMRTYIADMRITDIRRPYEGSRGIQFTVSHRHGAVYVVYGDLAAPCQEICKVPFNRVPWLILRAGDYFVYVTVDVHFHRTDMALYAALTLVQEEIAARGLPTDIQPFEPPITCDQAHEIVRLVDQPST